MSNLVCPECESIENERLNQWYNEDGSQGRSFHCFECSHVWVFPEKSHTEQIDGSLGVIDNQLVLMARYDNGEMFFSLQGNELVLSNNENSFKELSEISLQITFDEQNRPWQILYSGCIEG